MDLAEAAEEAMRDVKLKFTQVTQLKVTAETQEMNGELTLLKSPERFKVQFTSPTTHLFHYDGSRLVLFFPETGQAFRQEATLEDLTGLLGINPAASVKIFREGYRISLLGCFDQSCRLSFERTTPPELIWNVQVSATTWYLEEASFENDEIKVILRFYDYQVNRGLSATSLFLKLPEDTTMYEGLPQFFNHGVAP